MAMNKYEYLLDHYLVNGKINVVRPVTAQNGLVLLLKICVRYGSFVVWLAINRLSFGAFNIFFLMNLLLLRIPFFCLTLHQSENQKRLQLGP